MQHPASAGAAQDVAGGAGGDGELPRDAETHRALHHRLQVPQLAVHLHSSYIKLKILFWYGGFQALFGALEDLTVWLG